MLNPSPKNLSFSPLSIEEERPIVAGLRIGDSKALSALYQAYGNALYRQVIDERL